LGHQISLLIAILVKDVTVILTKLWGYILVLIGFIGFVIYNRGIVVGDKSNHQVSFHPTQLLYFSLFLLPNLAIGLRHILRNLKLSVIRIFSNSVMFWTWLMLTSFFCAVVHYFTYFLLQEKKLIVYLEFLIHLYWQIIDITFSTFGRTFSQDIGGSNMPFAPYTVLLSSSLSPLLSVKSSLFLIINPKFFRFKRKSNCIFNLVIMHMCDIIAISID